MKHKSINQLHEELEELKDNHIKDIAKLDGTYWGTQYRILVGGMLIIVFFLMVALYKCGGFS